MKSTPGYFFIFTRDTSLFHLSQFISYICSSFKCKQIAKISACNRNLEMFTRLESKNKDVSQQETLRMSLMLTSKNKLFTLLRAKEFS